MPWPEPASADTTYNPPQWNGRIVYVSQACHDASDGVPGGPCITNSGCQSYSENEQSAITASSVIFGPNTGQDLLERGYRAIRGTGTVNQNVSNSNAAGADIHLPLHTNAQSTGCGNTNLSRHGTWGLHRYPDQQGCATQLADKVGGGSPGTDDKVVFRTDLGELNGVAGTACYLESEFHTWNTGVSWIRNEQNWSYRVGFAIDTYLGFP